MNLHVCLFDTDCWRDWWRYGMPMRVHVGDRTTGRHWTIPGFGWRARQVWAGAKPVVLTRSMEVVDHEPRTERDHQLSAHRRRA
jgi:hypothetical protein